jgi:hypothetical protein
VHAGSGHDGAYDYVTTPFDVEEIMALVGAGGGAAGARRREVRYLCALHSQVRIGGSGIIGSVHSVCT